MWQWKIREQSELINCVRVKEFRNLSIRRFVNAISMANENQPGIGDLFVLSPKHFRSRTVNGRWPHLKVCRWCNAKVSEESDRNLSMMLLDCVNATLWCLLSTRLESCESKHTDYRYRRLQIQNLNHTNSWLSWGPSDIAQSLGIIIKPFVLM